MSSTTLTMVAVMMTATFMVTAFVWHQPLQQTQAFRGSESRSPSCVENQPCHTSVTNASTPRSKLTSSPYSASSSKLVPSPASLFAPHSLLPNSFLPDTSSPHSSSPSSKLTQSPASVLAPHSSSSHSSSPSSKLKYHNSDSSTSTTSHASSSNSTELSYELSHLFD